MALNRQCWLNKPWGSARWRASLAGTIWPLLYQYPHRQGPLEAMGPEEGSLGQVGALLHVQGMSC